MTGPPPSSPDRTTNNTPPQTGDPLFFAKTFSLSSLLPSNTIPPPSSLKLRLDHHHQRLLHHRRLSRDTSSSATPPPPDLCPGNVGGETMIESPKCAVVDVYSCDNGKLTWFPLLRTPVHWTISRFQCRPQQLNGTHQYEDGGINAMTQSLSDYFTKPKSPKVDRYRDATQEGRG
ncbi:hypothetical protein RHMOL_Rhmol12G0109500 [Rhododendron molle]|uniref:Uncharacterized protein n=1 Tax=Rhododendron molle TaxID=49168 RepID=A0ACC0LGW1_RHOML|nr:hypothetical protein RHMOL_Rhmol12G0109500 [Rhododendron molle]